MLKRILAPLDGSELAELALPYAEELAGTLDSEVELVYVCEPAESQHRHMHQLYIEKMTEQVRSHIRAYHTREASSAAPVKPVILDGDPAAEIIDYAEKNDISFIVMVSHGRSGIMSWVMGGTAVKVLQRISKPVLLIRASTPSPRVSKGEMFKRILIPLDGSDIGEAALPYVKELTSKVESEVILFQVIAPGQHVHTIGGLDYVLFPEQEVEKMKVSAQQYLEGVSRRFAGTKATVRSEVKLGDPATEIIKFADETSTRLVAISTHGRSGIKRWVFGGVAHKVLQAGHTPLLLVRALG